MHRSYTRFALIAVVITLARVVVTSLLTEAPVLMPLPGTSLLSRDPESTLAARDKLPLACADAANLELIGGVSDTLAFELVEKRDRILNGAQTGLHSEEALQLAHGIGAATARKLLSYLSLSATCDAASYAPREPFAPPE
jgi:hypothetical protein